MACRRRPAIRKYALAREGLRPWRPSRRGWLCLAPKKRGNMRLFLVAALLAACGAPHRTHVAERRHRMRNGARAARHWRWNREHRTSCDSLRGLGKDDPLLREGGAHREIGTDRSEEHTSELQSLIRNSYAVSCLEKKKNN